tara:strand:- start:599 stop:1096 length:498 start_codon:yes stop_codon:yes gene_type:complete
LKRLAKFIFLSFVSFISCKEITTVEVQKDNSNSKTENYLEIKFESIYDVKYNSSIEEWINYFELNEFIGQLNSNDYSSLIDNKKFLVKFFKGIKFSIPDEINKPEIISRLTVIETDFMRFESMLSNYEIENEIKINMVKKINNSFSNLNFQIDKLLEKQEINLNQ